jgi:hypothetical protein
VRKKLPCNVCNVNPKAPGRGRRTCEGCEGLCKYCKGLLDPLRRCPACTKTKNRERYQNDPQYAAEKRIANKLSLYGITREEYDALEWACQACGVTYGKLVIDHDHTSGKVRGVLCNGCNTALGLLCEDVKRMAGLIDYMEKHSG